MVLRLVGLGRYILQCVRVSWFEYYEGSVRRAAAFCGGLSTVLVDEISSLLCAIGVQDGYHGSRSYVLVLYGGIVGYSACYAF